MTCYLVWVVAPATPQPKIPPHPLPRATCFFDGRNSQPQPQLYKILSDCHYVDEINDLLSKKKDNVLNSFRLKINKLIHTFLLFTEKKSARRRSRKNPKRKKNAKSNPWQISTLVCHKSAFPRIRHLLQFLQQFATLVLKTNANKIQFCRWALINLSVMI